MKVGKRNRAWLRIAVISATLASTASPIAMVAGEPVQRLGRTWGVGWGDGYHACNDSGLRLLDDLPPRSYSVSQRHRHAHGVGMRHSTGATYYDHFDAHQSGVPCDRCQAPVETAPQTVIMGSQVLRGYPQPPAVESPGQMTQLEAPSVETFQAVADSLKTDPVESVFPATDPLAADAEWDRLVLESETAGYQRAPKVMLPEKQYPLIAEPSEQLASDPTDAIFPNTPVFPLASNRTQGLVPAEPDAVEQDSTSEDSTSEEPAAAPSSTSEQAAAKDTAANDPAAKDIAAQDIGNAPVVIRALPSRTPAAILPEPPAEVAASPEVAPVAAADAKAAKEETLAAPPVVATPADSIEDAYVIVPQYATKPTPGSEDIQGPSTHSPATSIAVRHSGDAVASQDAAAEAATTPVVHDNPFFSVPPETRLVVPQRRSSSEMLMPPPVESSAVASSTAEATPVETSPVNNAAKRDSISETAARSPEPESAEKIDPPRIEPNATGSGQVPAGETVIPELPTQERETPRLRPHRLGSSTGKTARLAPNPLPPTGTSGSVVPPSVRVNPFASRPTVELAKRPSASSAGVIYQPTSDTNSKSR